MLQLHPITSIQLKILKKFKPDAHIFTVANKGYDVWPFLFVLNQIDLNNYSYFIKLHSKNYKGINTRIGKWRLTRKWWNNLLFSSLLGSRKIVKNNLVQMENDPKLGMIGSRYLITDNPINYSSVEQPVKLIMANLGFGNISKIVYVSGTMFLVRAELLGIFKNKYCENNFEEYTKSSIDGQLAHYLERVFGTYVAAQGYSIKGFDRFFAFELSSVALSVLRFLFQYKITKSNKRIIKILGIPIYSQPIN